MKVFIYDEKRIKGPDNLSNKGAKHLLEIDLKGYDMYLEEYPYIQKGKGIIKCDVFDVSNELLAELVCLYEERGMDGILCFHGEMAGIIFTANHIFPDDKIDGDYLKYLEELYKYEEFKKLAE